MPAGRPPLGLSVGITLADGSLARWDSGARAANRPQGLQFRTRTGDGFSDASVTLARRIDRDYIDLNLLDDVAFVGDDGATAYEGRVAGIPRSFGDTHSVTVNCAGWMAHARDRKFREIYVDRDLSAWQTMARQRRAALVAGWSIFDPAVDTDASGSLPAIRHEFTGSWTGVVTGALSESWYDAGPGCKIGTVYFDSLGAGATGTGGSWNAFVSRSDDDAGTGKTDMVANLLATTLANSGYVDFSSVPRRYAVLQFRFDAAGGTDGKLYDYWWRNVAVYGNHGVSGQGTTNPHGVFASDVISNIAQRFCPELSVAGMSATTYPIPHLVFKDPTDPYDAFLECNKYHLWDLGVWEGKTLTYRPFDLSDYDWEVRLSDLGTTVDLQGDSADDVANGIAVNYTDVGTGVAARITPADDTTLSDTSIENPVNAHGLTKWTELTLTSPTTAAAAAQIGRIALAEFNLPKAPGTITVQGHIKDRAGHYQQGWKVRAGDTVAITDHPNDRPRLVTETSWDQDSKTLTISVEGPAHRIDALFDRITTSLTAGNLAA